LTIRLAGVAVAAWLVIAGLGANGASALPPGSFSPTDRMTEGRDGAVAAPLPDGRVLVAGGSEYDGYESCVCLYPPQIVLTLRSAEIFNPSTGRWSPTGSMNVPRTDADAAPLLDGRVLVVGGYDGTNSLESAEIFDPRTGSFSPTGSMTEARLGAAAAPLPDGRVLVAGGGHYDNGTIVAEDSIEVFDPGTGTFSPTSWRMTAPRFGATAAPLPGGRVLIAGGDFYTRGSAEIFDPATGSSSSTGPMLYGGGPAASLPDGRVLLAGSGSLDAPSQNAEIFDPTTGSFSSAGAASEGRAGGIAAPLPRGNVLLAGGFVSLGVHSGYRELQSAELFTPALSRRLTRAKVIVDVAVAGTVTVVEAGVSKRRRLLKRTSARGGPGRITLKLRPTAKGEQRLKSKHRLQVEAKISFAPARVRGRCVTLTGPCYGRGYAIRETKLLTLKAKKRR
jgi:hypothetical protein